MTATLAPWLAFTRHSPAATVRLFCFPYAGGRAAVYRDWSHALPPTVDVCPVELPGRGVRASEPPFTRLTDLVPDLAAGLEPHLDRPFALFGHSVGGLIAFELARWLRRTNGLRPEYLFVSSHRAPHLPYHGRLTSSLSQLELLAHLQRLGGTPTELLREPELLQRMLPVLQADSALTQTNTYTHQAPLECPLLVFGGWDDPLVGRDQLEAWAEHTTASCGVRMFPGAHFYINTHRTRLLSTIGSELERVRSRR